MCIIILKYKKLRFILNKILLIMLLTILGFSGCGYKANPYYENDAPKSDENVKFTIKKSS